jgi:parallel beta-helix repeat protein
MRMKILPLLLLAALPVFAQSGDLSVSFSSETRVPAAFGYRYVVLVHWTGTEPARDVVLEVNLPGDPNLLHVRADGMKCTGTSPVRCTIPLLKAGELFVGLGAAVVLPDTAGVYTATATVSTTTPEGPPQNNSATHVLTVAGLPDLRGSIIAEDATLDPGGVGDARMGVSNNGATATNVVVRIRVEDGGEVLRVVPTDWGFGLPLFHCTVENGEAVCRLDRLPPHDFELVRLQYRAPNRREGGKVVLTGTVESDREDFDPQNDTFSTPVPLRRMFVVTSAEDDGPGSLRQTIIDSRADCAVMACTIAFEGLGKIQPVTPLPAIAGFTRIDGGAARVELEGSRLASGDGLLFDGGCEIQVRNLVVRNFPGHGLEARQTPESRQGCASAQLYVDGLYVSHSWLAGNTRGVVVKNMDAQLAWNVVHENRRAGIFLDGSDYSIVRNNVVVNNGASGIYVNTFSERVPAGYHAGADIVENVVHGNGEWGIARTRNNGYVQIRRNSTIRNGLYGIDAGLDLDTPNRDNDATGVPNKPELLSASYDPATGTTVIRGRLVWGASVDVYASSSLSVYGYPESERWLGEVHVPRGDVFELKVPGDLRGQWITATSSRNTTLYFLRGDAAPAANVYRGPTATNTSELSNAVQVK